MLEPLLYVDITVCMYSLVSAQFGTQLCVTSLIAMTECLTHSNTVGKAWQQRHEAAGYVASTVSKQINASTLLASSF